MRHLVINPRAERFARQQSGMEDVLAFSWRISVIVLGLVGLTFALEAGQEVLAPLFLAVVIGLMFGPLADRLERSAVPPALSALIVVMAFLGIIALALATIAMPISEWMVQWPRIWARIRSELAGWQEAMGSLKTISESLKALGSGDEALKVTVDDGSPVQDAAMLAPALMAQIIIFLASLYFFLATRRDIRAGILSLCFSRRLRWRVAHVFRDTETLVSRYLLSITAINIALGCAVSLALWLAGVPSAPLWGVLTALLNYVIYIGPAIMAVILLGVGLATGSTISEYFLPPAVYLGLNLVEAQFVTPHVIGRTLTLNPFMVFLSIGFWIWIWGPVGGFVAVPVLLIIVAVLRHVIPANHRRHVREQNIAANEAATIEEG